MSKQGTAVAMPVCLQTSLAPVDTTYLKHHQYVLRVTEMRGVSMGLTSWRMRRVSSLSRIS